MKLSNPEPSLSACMIHALCLYGHFTEGPLMVGEKGTCLFIGKISLCEMSSRDGLDDEGCSHKKKRGYVGKIPKRVEGGGGHLHCLSIVFSVQSNSRGHKVMAICKKSGIKHESSSSSDKSLSLLVFCCFLYLCFFNSLSA